MNRLARLFLSTVLCCASVVVVSLAGSAKPAEAAVTSSHTQAVHPSSTKGKTTTSSVSTYVVKSGDSFWGIAHRYHTSVSTITRMNHLSTSSVLHIGQKLLVPGAQTLSGRSDGDIAGLSSEVTGEKIAITSQAYEGVPYRWAGTTPSGFDCSGFVRYVYAKYGYNLPHSSYSMFQMGRSVSRSDLTPGTLVFFNSYGAGASHVGIYLGGGKFISAQGNGVQVASLYDAYWGGHYIGARDVLH